MEIPDLQRLPPDRSPSPYSIPIVIEDRQCGRLPEPLEVRTVGWLGSEVRSKGAVPDPCVDRLLEAYESGLKVRDGTRGCHECEVCEKESPESGPQIPQAVHWRGREAKIGSHDHHLVRLGNTVYMCPTMIVHYILDHGYRPPDEFLRAVADGEFLTAKELIPTGETIDEWIRRRTRETRRW